MKQLGVRSLERPDPPLSYQGTRLFGKVSNLTDYGAFVEIEQGIRRFGTRFRNGLDQQKRTPKQSCSTG